MDDEALAGRLKAGDRSALAEIEARFRRRLYRVAFLHCGSRDDADDLVQESLIAAWESIGRYLPGASFSSWLLGIAANRALAWRRKESLRRHAPLPDGLKARDTGDPEVLEALGSLAERERILLILRVLEGWPARRIAEHLGMEPASVSTALWKARKALRERLESEKGR